MRIIRLISISYVLLIHSFSFATDVQSIRVTKFTQNDGLSSDHVTKILKDKYGFIWVGTQEGLNVFDGKSFELFSNRSPSKHNLGGDYVLDLLEDRVRSLLWVQTSFGSVVAIDLISRSITQKLSNDDQNQSYSEVWSRCIDLHEDILWIGGLNTLSAWHIPSKTFLDISNVKDKLNAEGEYSISKVKHDDFGNTWLFLDGYGVVVLNSNRELIKVFSSKQLAQGDKQEKIFFWDAASTKEQIIVGTNWGLHYFNTGNSPIQIQLSKISASNFAAKNIASLAVISDSLLMISTTSHVYLQHLQSDYTLQLIDENLGEVSLTNVYHIYKDSKSDLVWLGSRSGLLNYHIINNPFTPISKSKDQRLRINNLNCIYKNERHFVYAGGTDGVYKIDTKSQQIDLLDSSTHSLLIFKGSNERVLVSTKEKLIILKGGEVYENQDFEKLPSDLLENQFHSAINYNDSLILLVSFELPRILTWNTKSNECYLFPHDSVKNRFPSFMHVINLYKQTDQQKVFALTGNSIIQFNPLNNKFKTVTIIDPSSQKSLANFMDMNEAGDKYFIGTYGEGLIETDKAFNVKKIYKTKDGLSNNCIYRIFFIKGKKMLMTTNNGLSVLDFEKGRFKTYYEGDGLHDNGFDQFCGYQKDNKIYVGGPGGFTIVNTDLLSDSSVAPILYPTGITINTPDGKIDSTHLEMSSFTIPNDAFKTTLKFVSPDYKNPDRMKYRYKIDELSKEWVELGNQNFVDLIGVNPGKYHFEVIATNSEGTDSEPLKMTLDFLPKWYQTTWFKILLLLLVAGLVYWVQRYRMIQIKKQQTIRKEIANDLHDDIGSTLNSLKIFAHLAQSDTNNKSHIEQIEESISEATVGLRDMIWVLEDEQDSVYEIMERIKKFASPICMAHDIEFVGAVNATSEKPIPKKIKRNIFLVAKECINNSVKYAECSRIEVVLAYSKSKLQLTIEDNGKGFDCDEITKGKGLDSMEYRANQVEFNCDIQSRVGSGTITTMQGTIG